MLWMQLRARVGMVRDPSQPFLFLSNTVHFEVEDAELQRTSALHKAIASDDQPFHFRLYDWFVEKRKTDQLLNVSHTVPSPV